MVPWALHGVAHEGDGSGEDEGSLHVVAVGKFKLLGRVGADTDVLATVTPSGSNPDGYILRHCIQT